MVTVAEGASLDSSGESLRQKDRTDRCLLESVAHPFGVRRTEGATQIEIWRNSQVDDRGRWQHLNMLPCVLFYLT